MRASIGMLMIGCLGFSGAPLVGQEKSAAPAEAVSAEVPAGLIEPLKVFEPMCGKTFRGEFANSTPEKPQWDVSTWERAMNGQAVRVLHSVNDGEYGGESILMWDPSVEKIRFWYFTTAGFYTTGTMDVDGKKWVSVEKVTGNANNITEVRSTSEFGRDGKFVTKAEYLQEGKWVPGHQITYQESPQSQVVFK